MESYMIRILYRNGDNPEKFVGVVEGTQGTIARGFVSMKGLWRILNASREDREREKDVSPEMEGTRTREELLDMFWSLREG